MADTKDLTILQGKTFSLLLRWEVEPIVYKQITAIQQTAPVRITSAEHGIPDGWRVAITSVKGMTEVNAEANKVRDRDYNPVTVVDMNTVEINAINAAGFKPYVSGGYLQFNTPADLEGYTARMSIKDKVGGTLLASSKIADAPLDILELTIDTALSAVIIKISAIDTAAIAWKKGVYELELESSTGVVTSLLSGAVSVTKEVTT